MSWAILGVEGSLSVYFGEAPTFDLLRRRMAKRRTVDFIQVNLRVQDGHGMTGFTVNPQHLQDYGLDRARNVIGSTVLSGLGSDVQAWRGPIALVGWIAANQRLAVLPKRFVNAIEHIHACVLAAFAGGATPADQAICDVGEFLQTVDFMTRRPVTDFYGRDRSPLRWYACPNHQCAHGSLFHDVHSLDDPRYQCCINGCSCGKGATSVLHPG